jgi:DNA-binding HxlR family transcriptional regulator
MLLISAVQSAILPHICSSDRMLTSSLRSLGQPRRMPLTASTYTQEHQYRQTETVRPLLASLLMWGRWSQSQER